MADDLHDSVDSLRYLVARPGTFADTYPETDEDMLVQVLSDGLAECQLMGMLLDRDCNDGMVNPSLDAGQNAMIVLFAGVRFLRSVLINQPTSVTYKAGSAEYQSSLSVQLLRDILAALQKQKDNIIENGGTIGGAGSAGRAFFMADQYLARVMNDWSCVGGDPIAVGW